MLLITEKQFEVLSQVQLNKFANEISQFCQSHLPEHYRLLSDEANLSKILNSIAEAKEIGLTWQSNIATICILDMKFQSSVLSDNKVREHILDSNDPDLHFHHLFTETTSDIWTHFEISSTNTPIH